MYLRTQEYEKSEQNLKFYREDRKRIQRLNEYFDALDLIDLYFARGKMEEAKKIIDEGLELFSKENEDIRDYYYTYYVKQSEYYFLQKDWKNYKKVNHLPAPLLLRIFMGGLNTKYKKMNRVYKYRRNEDFVDAYINHRLWKHKEVVKIKLDEDELNKEQKRAWQTMQGVAYYWLGDKDKAREYLKAANKKRNFLLDEASYYAALIEFEKGNYHEAEKQLKKYRSLLSSDVSEGIELSRRIDAKFGRLKLLWLNN